MRHCTVMKRSLDEQLFCIASTYVVFFHDADDGVEYLSAHFRLLHREFYYWSKKTHVE
jgi:hypothetical protein